MNFFISSSWLIFSVDSYFIYDCDFLFLISSVEDKKLRITMATCFVNERNSKIDCSRKSIFVQNVYEWKRGYVHITIEHRSLFIYLFIYLLFTYIYSNDTIMYNNEIFHITYVMARLSPKRFLPSNHKPIDNYTK
jgi:hypothetical protein